MSDAFECLLLGRPGSDLLSHVLGRSTIGAEGFHGRVRDGIGCLAPRNDHQVIEEEELHLMFAPARERMEFVGCSGLRPRGARVNEAANCADRFA